MKWLFGVMRFRFFQVYNLYRIGLVALSDDPIKVIIMPIDDNTSSEFVMTNEKFKTLYDMGVEDPNEVEKYTARIEGDLDVLKIYFLKHKGDWLAKSKKFKFKRQTTNRPISDNDLTAGFVTEPSPYFLRAVEELNQIVKHDKSIKSQKKQMLDELEHLEKVVARKIESLRHQIERME